MTEVEDEISESHARIFRAASGAGMRLIDMLARSGEDRKRREAEGQREAAAALERREVAQEKAMRTITGRALDPDFTNKASDRDLAMTFAWAEAYAQRDPVAKEAHERLSTHLRERHGDVGQFVDSNIGPGDLDRVPAPDGEISATQQRAADALSRDEQLMVTATEEQAAAWANIIDVQGERAASTWLESEVNQDADAMRNMERWSHIEQSETEVDEADERRAAAAEEPDTERAERLEAAAQRDDSEKALEDSLAEQERTGMGRYPNTPEQMKRVSDSSAEAGEALRVSLPGRAEPAADQVAAGRHRAKPPARRPRAGQDRTHDRSR